MNITNISFSAKNTLLDDKLPKNLKDKLSKNEVQRYLLSQLNNKSPKETLEFCNREFKAISIIVTANGKLEDARSKLKDFYHNYPEFSNKSESADERIESLLYLFKNQSNWFSKTINRSAAEFTYILVKIRNVINCAYHDASLTELEKININLLLEHADKFGKGYIHNIQLKQFAVDDTHQSYFKVMDKRNHNPMHIIDSMLSNQIKEKRIAINYQNIDLTNTKVHISLSDIQYKLYDTAIVNDNTEIELKFQVPITTNILKDVILDLILNRNTPFNTILFNQLLEFLTEKDILAMCLQNAKNLIQLPKYPDSIKSALLKYINTMKDRDREVFMLNNNSFFIQLIFQCVNSDNTNEIVDLAKNLYTKYLGTKKIKQYTKNSMFGDLEGDKNTDKYGKPDWNDNNSLNYILIKDGMAIMISHNYLNILNSYTNLPEFNWNQICYFKKNSSDCAEINSFELKDVFNNFKIFKKPYSFYNGKIKKFVQLFIALNLGDIYQPLFTSALLNKSSTHKLVKLGDQKALVKIFKPVLMNHITTREYNNITKEHYNQLLKIFILEQETDTIKAQTLVCLALMFTRFSSIHYFGTEFDSPSQLRLYAAVLLRRASQLDNTLDKDMIDNFIRRLLTDCCTEILASNIRQFISKNSNFRVLLNNFLPPAWA